MENNIKILGYKAVIDNINETLYEVNNLFDSKESVVQLLDADGVAGKDHVLHAVYQAISAFDSDESIASDLGVEVLVRLSAQRQISKAFDMLGLKNGEMNICIVLINCPEQTETQLNTLFTRDDTVLEAEDEKLINLYGITDKELQVLSIKHILIEKTTMLFVNH